MRDGIVYPLDTVDRGILYFVTPALLNFVRRATSNVPVLCRELL